MKKDAKKQDKDEQEESPTLKIVARNAAICITIAATLVALGVYFPAFILPVSIILGLATTAGLIYGAYRLYRLAGERGVLIAIPPANMYGLQVMRGQDDDDEVNGGAIVDVIHAIPGRKIVKPSTDQYTWHFADGEEDRGWLFRNFGIVWLGLFTTMRRNVVHSVRWSREEGKTEYQLMPKDKKDVVWVYYSGQHDIEIKDAETKGNLKLSFKVSLQKEDTYPVMARLKVADSTGVLSLLARERTISVTGRNEPEAFTCGEVDGKVRDGKRIIADEVQKISGDMSNPGATEKQIGVTITNVNVFDVDMDEQTRKALEARERAKLQADADIITSEKRIKVAENNAKANVAEARGKAEAAVIDAEAKKRAKILDNDASADHIDRVMRPMASDPRMVDIRKAEAYENNTTIHTYAPGSGFGFIMSSDEPRPHPKQDTAA